MPFFFDTSLSKTGDISCATCHDPQRGFEDGLRRGTGTTRTVLNRHTPTLLNLAWSQSYFWDGRAQSLEEQALGPLFAKAEMGMTPEILVSRVSHDKYYDQTFNDVFPESGITPQSIAMAIAAFERTLISKEAPFDMWISGDETALSEAAKRGFSVFNGKARCSLCHMGWNFTDDGFHDIGLESEDQGRYAILDFPTMRHAFKTPGLRNISERAPYMHDGSLSTLDDVIRHYDGGFVRRDSLSEIIQPLNLTASERLDLIAFLNSLNSAVPSQLTGTDKKKHLVSIKD